MPSERNAEWQNGRLSQEKREALRLRKKEQRREGMKRRSRLTGEERAWAEERIRNAFFDLPQYQLSGRLLIYASHGEEVSTWKLMEEALAAGKQVFCPRVERARNMSFYRISGREELVPGFRGILEPPEEERRKYRMQLLTEGTADLVVMPGAAFDRSCERVGYGRGYYDRFLAGYAGFTAALCRRELLLDRVPREGHDLGVDLVITEEGLYGPSAPGTTESGAC